jgi:hypothetical protein
MATYVTIRTISRAESIITRKEFVHALGAKCGSPPYEEATREIYSVLYGMTYEEVREAHRLDPIGTRNLRDVIGPGGLQALALTEELATMRLNAGPWLSAEEVIALVVQAATDVLSDLEGRF